MAVAEVWLVTLQEGQHRLDVRSHRVAAACRLWRETFLTLLCIYEFGVLFVRLLITVPATKGTSLRLSL